MTSRFRQVPALWQMADWADKRVGVVNWYAARPAEKIKNGVFIARGVLTPDKIAANQAYPSEWLDKARAAPAPPVPEYEDFIGKIGDLRVKRAYEQDRTVFTIALEILREERPDLMMVYFQNVDVLCHGFWKYYKPIGPDHSFDVSPADRDRYGSVIARHYEFTDRMIGGLLGEADGYQVIVLSDHGFRPTYPPQNIFIDLNQLLKRMGYLTYNAKGCEEIILQLDDNGEMLLPEPASQAAFEICQQLSQATMQRMAMEKKTLTPPEVDAFLAHFHELDEPRNEVEQDARIRLMVELAEKIIPGALDREINFSKTVAWNGQDFHKSVRGIYLNLEGREPEGLVPKKKYDKMRRGIAADLASLYTDGGLRLFKSVIPNPDKQAMPMTLADQPDILIEVNQDAVTHILARRGPDDKEPIPLSAVRWSFGDVSGDHAPEGVIIIAGDKAVQTKRLSTSPLDVAPTVLWLMGLPLGADMPGRVLAEAFNQKMMDRPPIYIDSYMNVITAGVSSPPVELSPEIKKQMQGVGYIQN